MATMEHCFAVLDRLEESDLLRFKSYLYERTLPDFTPLGRGQVEKCDSTALAGKMKDAYGRACVKLITHILQKMNKAHLLEDC